MGSVEPSSTLAGAASARVSSLTCNPLALLCHALEILRYVGRLQRERLPVARIECLGSKIVDQLGGRARRYCSMRCVRHLRDRRRGLVTGCRPASATPGK